MNPKTLRLVVSSGLFALAVGLSGHRAQAQGAVMPPASTPGAPTPSASPISPATEGRHLSPEDRLLNLLRPARVEIAALAPDGAHLAYVADDPNRVQLVLVDLAQPESPAHLDLGQGKWWQEHGDTTRDYPQVSFLRWANAQRLVFSIGAGGVYAVNADASGMTKLVSAKDIGTLDGPDVNSVAPFTPPGLPITPNQLDQMAGSPKLNLDRGAAPLGPGPASSHYLDAGGPGDVSYIHPGTELDRAVDMDAPLQTGRSREFTSERQPRFPRVVAMPPDDPDHIIVEATAARNSLTGLYAYGLFRAAIADGKFVSLGEAMLPGHRVLYDRDGHLRIVRSAVGGAYLQVFPSSAIWRGAKSLDRIVRDPAARGFRASAETFLAAHSTPMGFGSDPNILYYASDLGRDTIGLYALDLKSGERTSFAVEDPAFDVIDRNLAGNPERPDESVNPLIFDSHLRQLVGVRLAGPLPSTRWFDPELEKIQKKLDRKFSGRTAKILQWDDQRTRYLVFTIGRSDPGRYYVYTAASDQMLLCARRAPWIPSDGVSPTVLFAIPGPDGATLTGSLTFAQNARIKPAPLVVLCPDGPGQSLPPEFDREAQAYAGMGFMVLRVNYRGTGGLGLRYLDAIRGNLDRGPIDDILSAIKAIRARMPIDVKRIAVVGEGFGGYLALRAVQIHPEWFRSAVAIGPPVDLRQWVHETDLIARTQTQADDHASFQTLSAEQQGINPLLTLDPLHANVNPPAPTPPREDSPALFVAKARLAFFSSDPEDLAAISLARAPQDLVRPILMIQDANADPGYISSTNALRHRIEKQGGQVDFITVPGRLSELNTLDRIKTIAQIEDFLNLDFYSYHVEIGELKTKD